MTILEISLITSLPLLVVLLNKHPSEAGLADIPLSGPLLSLSDRSFLSHSKFFLLLKKKTQRTKTGDFRNTSSIRTIKLQESKHYKINEVLTAP